MKYILALIITLFSLTSFGHQKRLLYSHNGDGEKISGSMRVLKQAVLSGHKISLVVVVGEKVETFYPERMIIDGGHVFLVHRLIIANSKFKDGKLEFNNKLKGDSVFGTNGLETFKLDSGSEYNNKLTMKWYLR